jgi:hypothetical protein
MVESLGKLITTPGTLVRLTANRPVLLGLPQGYSVHAVLVQALPANTGKVYIGTSALNRAALTGVIGVLAIPTVNSIPSMSIALTAVAAGVGIDDLYIDVDVGSEGVIVSALVA